MLAVNAAEVVRMLRNPSWDNIPEMKPGHPKISDEARELFNDFIGFLADVIEYQECTTVTPSQFAEFSEFILDEVFQMAKERRVVTEEVLHQNRENIFSLGGVAAQMMYGKGPFTQEVVHILTPNLVVL